MTFPLQGIKVLEISEMLFAPSAAAALGDWGADVIKIERPKTGDRARGIIATGVIPYASINYLWEQANRGKKSVALDINTPRGLEIVYKLAEQSDIFITNFLTDARQRIGIEYEDLAKVNPRLIYLRANGYGPRGAERDRGGYDYAAFWARGGFAATLGQPGGPPTLQRPGLGDNTGGIIGAGSIAAALFNRERTGKGALIDMSLLSCAMWVNSLDILAGYYTGQPIPRLGRFDMGSPLWNGYQTSDGRWLQLVMLQSDPYWTGFCQAIDRPDIEHEPRFATHDDRCANNKILIGMLDTIFASKRLAEWGELLDANGCLWTVILDPSELASDPQVVANDFMISAGDVKVVASPSQFDSKPLTATSRAPRCGQDTEEILLALGYDHEEIDEMREGRVI